MSDRTIERLKVQGRIPNQSTGYGVSDLARSLTAEPNTTWHP